MQTILASSSPRRKIILQNYFDNLLIVIPSIDEIARTDEVPVKFCERISKEKARSVSKEINGSDSVLIISCDTIVTIENNIIGKPINLNDAINKINMLSGKMHSVFSSITLLHQESGEKKYLTRTETSNVNFKQLSGNDIVNYLNKINYMDKAGAYAIQEHGDLIINSIQGSMTNIIGFPLRLFFRMLSEMNLLYKL
ncbi:MAG: septum formation protein Maf [Spirochaetes bacterium]|nr:septum formation protein Maf [Spirochaetota bacterium]